MAGGRRDLKEEVGKMCATGWIQAATFRPFWKTGEGLCSAVEVLWRLLMMIMVKRRSQRSNFIIYLRPLASTRVPSMKESLTYF